MFVKKIFFGINPKHSLYRLCPSRITISTRRSSHKCTVGEDGAHDQHIEQSAGCCQGMLINTLQKQSPQTFYIQPSGKMINISKTATESHHFFPHKCRWGV